MGVNSSYTQRNCISDHRLDNIRERIDMATKKFLIVMLYDGLGYAAFVLFASVGYNILAGGNAVDRVPTVAMFTGLGFVVGCVVGLFKHLARK